MEKKSANRGLIFLLILLVAVGIFLLYSRLTFTGYVTNVVNATTGVPISSFEFSGVFYHTLLISGNIVLQSSQTTGSYTSDVFDAGQNVFWTDFVPTSIMHSSSNYTEDPLNNSIIFYVRACNDAACTGKNFVSPQNNLAGQYFQYKAEMQILSGNESPVLSEVNVSYYPPVSLPISIASPQAIIYNNESVLIKISTNQNVTVWFFNETGNETYTGEFNRTFNQGQHTLTAWVSYTEGVMTFTNSTSVAFSVEFLQAFYRLANNACSQINIVLSQKTANDYDTLVLCQSHITTTNTTTTPPETIPQSCAPSWECAWGECVDGIQTETCTDTSTCTTVAEPPPVRTQSCIGGITTTEPVTPVPVTTASTTTPTKKGFFSFVGSAIVGPIFKSKLGVAFVILLVLVAGGLLAYKFLLKDKLKLKFFGKKKFLSFN